MQSTKNGRLRGRLAAITQALLALGAASTAGAGETGEGALKGRLEGDPSATSPASPASPPAPPDFVFQSRGEAGNYHASRPSRVTPQALPTGGDKTGVSSEAIAVPQGAGKIQGMGESFSTQMSTGVATFTVPFGLPHARGGSQPSLTLTYSSAAGHGLAGVGWDLGWPFIARQTDRGLPGYDDRAEWHPQQDRFVFNGGQELVPLCVVHGTACAATLPAGEVMPAWADGWQYFRARVEGSYLRFFWSPDHRTWRIQSKGGESMELGAPLDGSGYAGGLEADPANAAHVFRWDLVRQYDDEGSPPPAGAAQPAPVNAIAYRYTNVGGIAYLSDVYATPPAANPASAPLATYAQHVRLVYATRPDATISFRRGWRIDQTLRLMGVDVTSAPFSGGGARRAVRRYHLAYDPSFHASLLASVQLEGRCDGGEQSAPVEDPSTQALPATTGCPSLPAVTFAYQHVTPFAADGSAGVADLAGFEGFDERIVRMKDSPPNSVDEDQADLFDINSDGLPDVVATIPGAKSRFPLYLNGAGGSADTFGALTLGVFGVLGANATSLRLSNDNLASLDIDGDGIIDWLHQPAVRSYAVYTPQLLSDGWSMVGRAVAVAAQQDPRLDLGDDTPDINVFDVNGDGLVDVVRATGTEMQTFFSLGRYPGGDGSFGSARWTGPTTAGLSLSFVPSCVPLVSSGVPVRFSDSSIRLGDLNGDGLTDLVYVYRGDIRYWPGRGDGSWGTGALGGCTSGFSENTYLSMAQSPVYSDPDGSGIRLDDVNGDGLDDLVQVRIDGIDIWLNVDGVGFTAQRHKIDGLQPAQGPLWASKVRIADINGSGTRDVLWGEGGSYRYIDLAGGERPWVLTHVDNGLGKTTDIAYGSSTELMLAAEAAGQPWQSKAPMPLHLVKSSTERDNLGVVGRPAGEYVTEYTYRDPVYDGRQREFRGFRSAVATHWGDTNSPTSYEASQFALGECADDEPPPAGLSSVCSPAGRWADNPREALKGLPLLSETYDGNGTYFATEHHSYTLRKLYDGIDGRTVRVTFESQSDMWKYDTAAFVKAESSVAMSDVTLDSPTARTQSATLAPVTVRSKGGAAHLETSKTIDAFGNEGLEIDLGCVDGAACPTADSPIRKTTASAIVPGDASGWLWRPVESYVDGLSQGEQRNHAYLSYDSNGHLKESDGDLKGTLSLDRFHESAGAGTAANTPPRASHDGRIMLSSSAYDGYGNLVAVAAPGGRCRAVEYATDFADVAIREHLFAGATTGGGTCGSLGTPRGANDLVTTARYDRGFAAIVDDIDLHGELTHSDFDGFGRVVRLWKPSPTAIGQTSPAPSIVIDYDLARTGRPYSIVHTQTQSGATDADAVYRDAYAYTDGFQRSILTLEQADPSVDLHQWVVDGLTDYDDKGAPRRAFLPWFWDGDPRTYPVAQQAPGAYTRQRYDAFGEVAQSYGLDGSLILQTVHHALSVEKWDAGDLAPGPHAGSYASARQDGHGRAVSAMERTHVGGGIETHEIRTDFLPTGEPYRVTRTRAKGDDVVRWLRYDTLGRVVLNVEPDATKNFTADASADPGALKAWRYAYDDNGDLVGTSDARGCGADYHYDTAGRILAEDYSPCLAVQAPYSKADPVTGFGTEVFYQYDSVPVSLPGDTPEPDGGVSGSATFDACTIDPRLQNGRLVAMSDRASRKITGVDGRGRTTCVAKQIAKPGVPGDSPADRYAPRWYSQSFSHDGGDREVTATTGARALVDPASQTSAVHTEYTLRGSVKRVAASYGQKDASGWADLVASVTHDAHGLVQQIVYGDLAHTTTSKSYDAKRRLSSVQTYRAAPAAWTQPTAPYSPPPEYGSATPTSFQLLLEDVDYVYDVIDNPVEIRDWRVASEWPAGAQPVSRKMQYDDQSRVSRVDYVYPNGSDVWVDPFAAEDQGDASQQDRRRAAPSPHASFDKRGLWETFRYDWLGNTVGTDDDAKGFYDRSLGTITNGAAGAQPYQLKSAAGGAAPRDGSVAAAYDVAGNLTGLSLVRNANTPCVPSGAICSQRFAYDWDEVGRLVRARRWDGASLGAVAGPLPADPPAVELHYAYGGNDDRVLKTAIDPKGNQVHTAYVFTAFELRRATFDGTDYEDSASTEAVYLFAHGVRLARIHYAATDVPTSSSGQIHVLLELPDYLGSSAIVLDRDTGELVERSGYRAAGGAESDYRPARWDSFREDYRFSGKEEDVEVGLDFFGKRYYSPALARWTSADPLALHSPGDADLNLYAYVEGRWLAATDPTGLDKQGLINWDSFRPRNIANYALGVKDGVVEMGKGIGHSVAHPVDSYHAVKAQVVKAYDEGGVTGVARQMIADPIKNGYKAMKAAEARGDYRAAGKEAFKTGVAAGLTLTGTGSALKVAEKLATAGLDTLVAVEGGQLALTMAAKDGAKGTLATTLKEIGDHASELLKATGACFAEGTPVATPGGFVPIETLRVGDRVLTSDKAADGETSVDPAHWLDVRLRMPNPDGSGDVLEVEVLRPIEWVVEVGAATGEWVAFGLPEMGLFGPARVESVSRIAEIQPGAGRVVRATVTHWNSELREVSFAETNEILRPTSTHRLYSLDRGAWVAAGELRRGERLWTESGVLTVESNEAVSGLHRVYNIEVETDHSYLVGYGRVLSHNVNPCAQTLEGAVGTVVKRANGDIITDIDRVVNGVLMEEKSATGLFGEGSKWIAKHVEKKFSAYMEARQNLPGYENAPIGFRFTDPVTPDFRAAVEASVSGLRAQNPTVNIVLEFTK